MSNSREGGSRCKNVLAALSGMGLVSPPLAHCREVGEGVLLSWRDMSVGVRVVVGPW